VDNFNNNHSEMDAESIKKAIADIDAKLARLGEQLSDSAPAAPTARVVSTSSQKKMFVSAFLVLIAMISMVVSSLAYFTTSQHSSGNMIATGSVSVDFVDLDYSSSGGGSSGGGSSGGGSSGTELDPIPFMPGYSREQKVYAVNNGGISIYLRAKIETEITLDAKYASYSDEIDTSLVVFDIDENFWTLKDGYYYYSVPLHSGKISPELFTEILFSPAMGNIYKDSTIKIKLTFEMVQANGNGGNVFEAVGWPTESQGGTP